MPRTHRPPVLFSSNGCLHRRQGSTALRFGVPYRRPESGRWIIQGAHSRPVLNRMVERGLIDIRGTGRQREFHLSAGFYESANRKTEYVRSAPVDVIRREELVLKYVNEYGQITRQQASELCDMTPNQASYLLRSMTQSGSLVLRGERRGAHYVKPENTSAANK